jgi:DNA repair protein RadD
VAEFRKPDSYIRGLITVTAASKGFDIPDIGCVIMARPLRKSLAEHIQFFGRGLRSYPGKADCLVLDHSGNSARFWSEWNEFFETGAVELDDGKKKAKPKKAADAADGMKKCPSCRALHKPMPFCPACGHQYPAKAGVQHVPGSLKELVATGDANLLRRELWPQVCAYVLPTCGDDIERAQRKAQAIYHEITGEFAKARVENTTPVPCSREVANKIRANQIRWAKGRQAREARA